VAARQHSRASAACRPCALRSVRAVRKPKNWSQELGVGKTLTVWPPGTRFAVPGEQEKRVGRPRTRPKPVEDATPLSAQSLGGLPSTKTIGRCPCLSEPSVNHREHRCASDQVVPGPRAPRVANSRVRPLRCFVAAEPARASFASTNSERIQASCWKPAGTFAPVMSQFWKTAPVVRAPVRSAPARSALRTCALRM